MSAPTGRPQDSSTAGHSCLHDLEAVQLQQQSGKERPASPIIHMPSVKPHGLGLHSTSLLCHLCHVLRPVRQPATVSGRKMIVSDVREQL